MSETDVVNRCLALHAVTPFQNQTDPMNTTPMTNEEVTEMVTNWYQSKIAE